MEKIIQLSKGNIGAANVLAQIMKINPTTSPAIFDFLSENKLTGPIIWILYKDWQNENVLSLISKILNHPEEVLNYVNSNTEVQYYINRV